MMGQGIPGPTCLAIPEEDPPLAHDPDPSPAWRTNEVKPSALMPQVIQDGFQRSLGPPTLLSHESRKSLQRDGDLRVSLEDTFHLKGHGVR
jgi:hypothetical protein